MTNVSLVVKILATNNDGKVLVLQRSKDDEHAPGRVDLPGGGVDRGESFEAAMKRELFEEAGLHVDVADLQPVYTFTKLDSNSGDVIIRLMYVVKVGDQQVRLSHEHSSFMWQTIEEVEALFEGLSWGEAIEFALKNQLLNA